MSQFNYYRGEDVSETRANAVVRRILVNIGSVKNQHRSDTPYAIGNTNHRCYSRDCLLNWGTTEEMLKSLIRVCYPQMLLCTFTMFYDCSIETCYVAYRFPQRYSLDGPFVSIKYLNVDRSTVLRVMAT